MSTRKHGINVQYLYDNLSVTKICVIFRSPMCLFAGYSKNLCDLMWCWDQRLNVTRKVFGDRLKCIFPGVIATKEKMLPMCETFMDTEVFNALSFPAIGIHQKVGSERI